MTDAVLTIDLDAIAANWRALAGMAPSAQAGAVVKADAYSLGAARVASRLYEEGARHFFVALAAEGQAIRHHVGSDAQVFVLSGHMDGAPLEGLIPVLNSPAQFFRDRTVRSGKPFAIQLDTGMNRLGFEPAEWAGLRDEAMAAGPSLIMSHLCCSDTPEHSMNAQQLGAFKQMTDGCDVPRSLAATGGVLLGPDYHFDITRPGIGLYGGLPFADARPVVTLSLPVIQTRLVAPGEIVGYSGTWKAERPTVVATVAAGYADGILRSLSSDGQKPRLSLMAGDVACPVLGRVSMDLLAADVTALADVPACLHLLSDAQTIEAVANAAGTIGYEVLTSLGPRYSRRYSS